MDERFYSLYIYGLAVIINGLCELFYGLCELSLDNSISMLLDVRLHLVFRVFLRDLVVFQLVSPFLHRF